jgi:predicted dehydrogenase
MRPLSRRQFLTSAAAIAPALYVANSLAAAPSRSPNEKLDLAVIGPGNRGGENLKAVSGENIVAICDVDERMAAPAFEKFPQAGRYRDFRKLLDRERLDGIVVSTTDHVHAHASLAGMRRGLHCYCEKPLTHTVWEARLMAETAAEKRLATQMGTQIHASNNYRRVVEIIQAGTIGPVREVKVWVSSSRPSASELKKGTKIHYGGGDRPTEVMPVPPELDWELWLGPAPERPYHESYLPKHWRGWWDFGNGMLGDMGCHYIDLVFWSLGLRHPETILAEGPPVHPETAPLGLKVTWTFGPRGEQPPVKLVWMDGDRVEKPRHEKELPGAGVYFIGDKGTMFANYTGYRLFPEEQFKDFKPPAETIEKSVGHHQEWINAAKTGSPTLCHFGYSGALTETVLLGTVAYRTGKALQWDATALQALNAPEADQFLRRQYRKGWEL